MIWRHLITLLFASAVFFLSYGSVAGNLMFGQPEPGVVSEPGPTSDDDARFAQIAAILRLSATGHQYLELRERYHVVVRFESGQGSSFSQAANRIRLDSKHDPLNAALIFVHEMHHARTLHEGRKANRQAESRQEYVSHMLWEESEGMAAGIQAKLELEANGVDMGGLTLPLEQEYREAYQGAVDQARLAEPAPGARELSSIGMTAGVQALFNAHLRRETRSANTHEFIIDYYGRAWDEANPNKVFVTNLIRRVTGSVLLNVLINARLDPIGTQPWAKN